MSVSRTELRTECEVRIRVFLNGKADEGSCNVTGNQNMVPSTRKGVKNITELDMYGRPLD